MKLLLEQDFQSSEVKRRHSSQVGRLRAASEQNQDLSSTCTGGEGQVVKIKAGSGCADAECHCTQLQLIITYNSQH